jgi:hypothetical protein
MTEKTTKTKYVNIDARFSNEFQRFPFADYYIELQETIHNVKSLSVACIEIPISFFNICDVLKNNCFKILNIDNQKSTSITIPDENYNINTLIEKINNQLRVNKISDLNFNFSKNNSTTISSNKNRYIIDFTINNGENDSNNKLGSILGFGKPKYYIEPEKDCETEKYCNYLNPRYLFLEIRERERKNENNVNYAFSSSMMCSQISKYIIGRITMDYHTFPYGSVIPANLSNGMLITDTRRYKEKIRLEDLEVRLLNEFGFPICLNGFELSFCMVVEYECDDN